MPGIASVWLTQEELDALLRASTNTGTKLSQRMVDAVVPKLKEARNGLGCPVPQYQGPDFGQ